MHHTKATSATKNYYTHLAMTDQSRSSADSAMPALSDKKSASSFTPEISRHKPGPMQCTETCVKTSSWRRYSTDGLIFCISWDTYTECIAFWLTATCNMPTASTQRCAGRLGAALRMAIQRTESIRFAVTVPRSLTHTQKEGMLCTAPAVRVLPLVLVTLLVLKELCSRPGMKEKREHSAYIQKYLANEHHFVLTRWVLHTNEWIPAKCTDRITDLSRNYLFISVFNQFKKTAPGLYVQLSYSKHLPKHYMICGIIR